MVPFDRIHRYEDRDIGWNIGLLALVNGGSDLAGRIAQAQELVIRDNRSVRFFVGGDRLVTARYINGSDERYKSKAGLPTVNGDHVGLVLNFYF